uniref:LTI65/LTI78 PGEED repeat domain-containing protein n=1 Tax=Chenopodium quinoa TaxID=63459 RepID=A0A803LX25_CHEQI
DQNPTSDGNTLSTVGRAHDQEDDHLHRGKKLSVLGKVKEKAKKWRQTLIRKKSGHDDDGNRTPSWGVALEDYVDEDEHDHNIGSLAYESNCEPKSSKEVTKHERANPLASEKQIYNNNAKRQIDNEVKQKLPTLRFRTVRPTLGKSYSDNAVGNPSISDDSINEAPRAQSLGNHLREKHPSPSKFTLDTLIAQRKSNKQKEKLPHHEELLTEEAVVDESSETQNVIEESTCEGKRTKTEGDDDKINATREQEQESPITKKTESYANATEAIHDINNTSSSNTQQLPMGSPQSIREEQKWDKGVSLKEYFKNKLEPGEDEKVLSQVITEVISPRRSPTEKGVVEKVKTAVSMLLQSEEPSSPSSMKTSRSSSLIPVSINAHEVEEEGQEGGMQAN